MKLQLNRRQLLQSSLLQSLTMTKQKPMKQNTSYTVPLLTEVRLKKAFSLLST